MLTWHLLHTVAAAPCVRMQQAADNDGVSMLQDGLEGASLPQGVTSWGSETQRSAPIHVAPFREHLLWHLNPSKPEIRPMF